MISHRKHHPQLTAAIMQFARAAVGALASATLLTCMTACNPSEPAAPPPPSMPSEADVPPSAGSQDDGLIAPEWAKREIERMQKIMQETKPGGCDPPPLLHSGSCEGVGTCDTFPFLADFATSVVSVDVTNPGQVPGGPEPPIRGTELQVEVIHCGAVPSTIMTRSQDYLSSFFQPLSFSVQMELKEKYFLRISNDKVPDLRVMTFYRVGPPQPACDDGPPPEAAR